VPWTEVPIALELLRRRRRGVLHFHGYYEAPGSVVLGVRSYDTLLASRQAQAIQQAIAARYTLLFIGCGDGLTDPNFGALLEWSKELLSGSIYSHYALVRKGETRPKAPHVKFVEYGEKYEDLPPFIRAKLATPHSAERALTVPNAGFCIGREDEVNSLVDALLAGNPVPVLGGAGMGKTTIALQALHDARVAARFGSRRYFVQLDGAKTRPDVVASIALALGVPITPGAELAVFDTFAAAPAALVLDNAETPLDGDQEQVEELFARLSSIDPLSLVATIRGNERPHSVTWTKSVKANELTGEEATEAFVRWSGKPVFRNDPYLSKLLAALDGVPLAITLMARYAELFDSLDIVWQRWSEKRTAMLKDRTPGVGRLHDIAVSYELSIGVLTDSARRLLSVLALLPDGAAREDLSGIFADPDDAADELRRRALIVDEERRIRMRAPLREYIAAARPPEAPDEERAISYYASLAAEEGDKVGNAGGAEAVARLAPEVANVEAILSRSPELHLKALAPAVYGWGEFIRFTGVRSIAPMEGVITAAVAAGKSEIIALCANTLADIALTRSENEEARKRYEQALSLYQRADDVMGEANCILRLGDVALKRSDYEGARRRYEEALPLYQREGDVLGEANCIKGLGDIGSARSDNEGARKHYERALQLYQRIRSVLGEAHCIKSLGIIALRQSDHEGARKRYQEALPLYERVGDVQGEANCIKGLADIALEQSDHEGARKWYEKALPLYQRVGGVLGEANCIVGRGDIASAAGDATQALSHYRTALTLYVRIAERIQSGAPTSVSRA
ncbi:MAG TPA: tetratricopeptide repeat protein, partial [Thermoanaerobaculia bacterium]|nr:tetratricopeptide repeat protein [Thermoanaerobaculia bacterium]